jgi:hypothetical protein
MALVKRSVLKKIVAKGRLKKQKPVAFFFIKNRSNAHKTEFAPQVTNVSRILFNAISCSRPA